MPFNIIMLLLMFLYFGILAYFSWFRGAELMAFHFRIRPKGGKMDWWGQWMASPGFIWFLRIITSLFALVGLIGLIKEL